MHNSRSATLAAVRRNQPASLPLPTVLQFEGEASAARFTATLAGIGGKVIVLSDLNQMAEVLAQLFPPNYRLASALLPATVTVGPATPIAVLAGVEVAVLRGEMGVAENGAIWLPEPNMLHRALPTVTQHLILVLDQRHIVATMHQAYAQLPETGGYGIFLAGPSKTADIEQSLVIGAHGARSLTVLLH